MTESEPPAGLTALGKVASVLLVLTLVTLGAWIVSRQFRQPAPPAPIPQVGTSPLLPEPGAIALRSALPAPSRTATAIARGPHITPPRMTATGPEPSADAPLLGNWRFSSATGTTYDLQIVRAENDQFWLTANANSPFRGIYEVHGDKFVMVTPVSPNMNGLEWLIVSNDKLVVVTPAKPGAGPSYLGLSMTRVAANSTAPALP